MKAFSPIFKSAYSVSAPVTATSATGLHFLIAKMPIVADSIQVLPLETLIIQANFLLHGIFVEAKKSTKKPSQTHNIETSTPEHTDEETLVIPVIKSPTPSKPH